MPHIRYSFRHRDRRFRQPSEIGHDYFGTPGHDAGITGHTYSESAVTLRRNTQCPVSCCRAIRSRWRTLGTGPMYLKLGSRVMYPLASIAQHEHGRMRRATAGQELPQY